MAANREILTVTGISSIAEACLDFYLKGPAIAQNLQDKPLARDLTAAQKTFPGGKEYISQAVQGAWASDGAFMMGYTGADVVNYTHPDNLKRAKYKWYELHAGINIDMTEMKRDGLSVTDSTTGKGTTSHSDRDAHVITDLIENKLNDMGESWAIQFNDMCWRTGAQDAKAAPGVTSIISDTPTVGTTGGLSRADNAWWRNRARVGDTKLNPSAENQTMTMALRNEIIQLRRYGGKPNKAYCGSDFLAAQRLEVQAKGNYTMTGFKGKRDIGMGELALDGVEFEYDPTLDILGYSKRCYLLDMSKLVLYVMQGEDKKAHNPARPHEQYVILKAMTWTGGLCCWKLNGQGVYETEYAAA